MQTCFLIWSPHHIQKEKIQQNIVRVAGDPQPLHGCCINYLLDLYLTHIKLFIPIAIDFKFTCRGLRPLQVS